MRLILLRVVAATAAAVLVHARKDHNAVDRAAAIQHDLSPGETRQDLKAFLSNPTGELPDQFGADERATAESVEEEEEESSEQEDMDVDDDKKPTHSIRLRSKVVDIPVCTGRGCHRVKEQTMVYCIVQAYRSQPDVEANHLETPLPGANIFIKHDMPHHLDIHIERGGHGLLKTSLSAGKWHKFTAADTGEFPFAMEPALLNDLQYVRLRIDSMPDNVSWVLSAALLLLKPVAELQADDFMRSRNGHALIEMPEGDNSENRLTRESIEAFQRSVAQVSGPVAFSQASAVLSARTKESSSAESANNAPLLVEQFFATQDELVGRDADDQRGQTRRRDDSSDSDSGSSDDSSGDSSDDSPDDEPPHKRRRLYRRSLDPTFTSHRFDLARENVTTIHTNWLLQHHAGTTATPNSQQQKQQTHHRHWELQLGGGGQHAFTFVPHESEEAAHQRVDQLRRQHQSLFKRSISTLVDSIGYKLHRTFSDDVKDSDSPERQQELKGALADKDLKNIVVSSKGDNLWVRTIDGVGRVVSLVLKTVRQGFDFLLDLLQRVGIDLRKMVAWLRAVLNWNSMLRAIAVASHHIRTMPAYTMAMLAKSGEKFHSRVRGLKLEISKFFGQFNDQFGTDQKSRQTVQQQRATLQNELADVQRDEDHGASYVADLATRHLNDAKLECKVPQGVRGWDKQASAKSTMTRLANKVGEVFDSDKKRQEVHALIDTKQLKRGFIASAVSHFMKGVHAMIMPFFEVAEEINELLFEQLLGILKELNLFINCRMHVPYLDKVWRYVMKETQPLTLGVVLSIPGSSVMSAMYSLYNYGEEAFDNKDLTAIIAGSNAPDMLQCWTDCVDCRPRTRQQREHIFSTLMGFNKVFMNSVLAVTEPLQQFTPAKPFIHFVHHIFSFRSQSLESYEDGTYNSASLYTYLFGLVPLVFIQASTISTDMAEVASKKLAKAITADTMEVIIRVPHMALAVYEFMLDLVAERAQPHASGMLKKSVRGWFLTLKAMERGLETMPQMPGVFKLVQLELNFRLLSAAVGWARLNFGLFNQWVY